MLKFKVEKEYLNDGNVYINFIFNANELEEFKLFRNLMGDFFNKDEDELYNVGFKDELIIFYVSKNFIDLDEAKNWIKDRENFIIKKINEFWKKQKEFLKQSEINDEYEIKLD